jgi:hypothetical protein
VYVHYIEKIVRLTSEFLAGVAQELVADVAQSGDEGVLRSQPRGLHHITHTHTHTAQLLSLTSTIVQEMWGQNISLEAKYSAGNSRSSQCT